MKRSDKEIICEGFLFREHLEIYGLKILNYMNQYGTNYFFTNKPSESEKKDYEVYRLLDRLNYTLEQLIDVSIYLKHFNNSERYKKNGITFDRYFRYHMENYYGKVYTSFEIILILTNVFLRSNINYKNCKFEKVRDAIENENIRGMLILFENVIKNIRTRRNLNSHRGLFYDEDYEILLRDRIIKDLKKLREENQEDVNLNYRGINEEFILKNKYELMKKDFEKLIVLINGYLDILFESEKL